MNEFTAKKCGEVLAFAQVGQEILNRADGLEDVLGESTVKTMQEQLKTFEGELLTVLEDHHLEIAENKAVATGKKLIDLAERYIGDEWDNPVEVMEWLGFFEGAAVVHCSVIEGAATALALSDLLPLATRMKEFHHQTLHGVDTALQQAGSDRAMS
jgi:hypothetical protein